MQLMRAYKQDPLKPKKKKKKTKKNTITPA